MIIKQDRFKTNENGTLATLRVYNYNVERGSYYVVEDPKQPYKIAGETRIPAGKYKVTLRKEGGLLEKYQKRMDFDHPGMLWIRSVPQFEWVYIHIGNVKRDTDGCPCIGMACNKVQMAVRQSRVAYELFYKLVLPAALSGNLHLHITDEPEPIHNDSEQNPRRSMPTDRTNTGETMTAAHSKPAGFLPAATPRMTRETMAIMR